MTKNIAEAQEYINRQFVIASKRYNDSILNITIVSELSDVINAENTLKYLAGLNADMKALKIASLLLDNKEDTLQNMVVSLLSMEEKTNQHIITIISILTAE